jgi:hypothetical protein
MSLKSFLKSNVLFYLIICLGFLYGSFRLFKSGILWGAIPLLILSFIFIFIASKLIKFYSNSSLDRKEGEFLKKNGLKIKAEIVKVLHYSGNKKSYSSPFVIYAKAINPITYEEQIFISNFIWEDVYNILQRKKYIDVYVDTNNHKKYYMDLSSVGINKL